MGIASKTLRIPIVGFIESTVDPVLTHYVRRLLLHLVSKVSLFVVSPHKPCSGDAVSLLKRTRHFPGRFNLDPRPNSHLPVFHDQLGEGRMFVFYEDGWTQLGLVSGGAGGEGDGGGRTRVASGGVEAAGRGEGALSGVASDEAVGAG